MKSETNRPISPFIDRVANILTSLSEGFNTVSEISEHCKLNVSTTHRFLNILSKPGFISYDVINHKYYLGPLIGSLSSNNNMTHQYLILNAYSVLKTLSDVSTETVTLSTLFGNQVIQLYEIPNKHSIQIKEKIEGIPILFPVGAAQKTLIAQMNDENLNRFLKFLDVWSGRNNFDFEKDLFLLERSQILNQGFCVSAGERLAGGMCISAPVKNYYCPVALSILGLESRLRPRLKEMTVVIKECADKLSNSLIQQ